MITINDIDVWNSNDKDNLGIRINWCSDEGFGTYTIGRYDGLWYIDDECMDDENRTFGKNVMCSLIDEIGSIMHQYIEENKHV